jgi:hypothetical protein
MLGVYDNFPLNIHRTEKFTTTLSTRSLQQKLIQVLQEMNRKKFCSSDIVHPSLPGSALIFEIGLADGKNFNFIDKEETKRVRNALRKDTLRVLDLFCAVRYCRDDKERKAPLRFDYFMARLVFGGDSIEMQVFHERGPRYFSPEDLITFLANEMNKTSAKKILKMSEPY